MREKPYIVMIEQTVTYLVPVMAIDTSDAEEEALDELADDKEQYFWELECEEVVSVERDLGDDDASI